MLAHGIRSVPIVEHGHLVGVISRRDVLRCVARRELTAAEVLARQSDAYVRSSVRSAVVPAPPLG